MQNSIEKATKRRRLPLPANVQRFIEAYLRERDLDKAALRSGFTLEGARKLWKTRSIHKEIHRRLAIEERANAKTAAVARRLTVEFIDSELVTSIKKETGAPKVKAIEVGYGRLHISLDTGPRIENQPEGQRPNIYRALQTTTVRRTLTEEVTQQQELAPAAEPLALPSLKPEPGSFEILDLEP